jgi:pseudoazurin
MRKTSMRKTSMRKTSMRKTSMRKTSINILLLALLFLTELAYSAEHKVQMLNSGAEGYMVFEPSVLTIEPGDSVTFVATDPAHNSASIEGMIPNGAAQWSGKLSEDVTVTFDKAGVYVYQCTPHAMMAMVGVINVGNSKENLKIVKAAAAVKKNSFVTNKERLDIYLSLL